MKFGRQQTLFVQYKVRYYLWKNLTKADKKLESIGSVFAV